MASRNKGFELESIKIITPTGCIGNLLTREIVAQAYGIPVSDITNFETFDNVSAIKATLKRKIASGSPGDSDCYGMNQEGPLFQISFGSDVLHRDG